MSKDKKPKVIISNATGILLEKVKDVMNSYLNGHRLIGDWIKLDDFVKNEFPLIHYIWNITNKKTTGPNISKFFETKIMLDDRIYKKCRELGYIAGYENDGVSLYSSEEDKNDRKFNQLLDFIENLSVELLGIRLVFVNKTNRIFFNDLLKYSKEKNNLKVLDKINELSEKETYFRKKYFGCIKYCNAFTKDVRDKWLKSKDRLNNYLLKNQKQIEEME